MRKSIAVAAIGLGFLFVAGPAHAADGDGTADVSSYALVPTKPVEPSVLSDAPVPAVVPPAAVAAANGGLPVTGSNSDAILQIGAAALLTGGGLVIVSQKRNRKARQS